jgi:hypothetical protein
MLVVVDALKAVEHMRPGGYMDAILGSGVVREEPGVGDVVDIPDAAYWDLVRSYSPAEFHNRVSLYYCGPGCQLKKSLAWFGIRSDGSCGCDSFAAQMDAWGPDECEARIGEIVAHLVEQAAKKSVFLGAVPSAAVAVIVRRAIEAARAEAAAGNSKPSPPEA